MIRPRPAQGPEDGPELDVDEANPHLVRISCLGCLEGYKPEELDEQGYCWWCEKEGKTCPCSGAEK